MSTDSQQQQNGSPVEVELTGELNGFPAIFRRPVRSVGELQTFVALLLKGGVKPPYKPLVYDHDADGLPICPRHGVAMALREHQGDTWHSHKVEGPRGEEMYCKGRPGKDSAGWDCDDV